MKLIYVYHSCFAVEIDNVIIIIDFFKDTEDNKKGIVHDRLLKEKNREIYVLSSHAHRDHFNPEILTWKEINPNIRYIFSKDILDSQKAKQHDATFLDAFESYQDENLMVKSYGSTDIGISFLIEIGSKTIFHAGDLNNWHWKDESTEEEVLACENAFLAELAKLATDYKHINVVMFPVDSRLGTDYMRGAEQFIQQIKIDCFSPMHFGKNYKEASAFKTYAAQKGIHFIDWEYKGQMVKI